MSCAIESRSYWLSYRPSRRQLLVCARGWESTLITIVLEAEAREHFAGIRVLITCDWATSGIDRESFRSSLDVPSKTSETSTYRNQLHHRRDVQSLSRSNALQSRKPLYTVVFELLQIPSTSTLMLRMRQQGSIDNPSERLCILNDLKYPHPELYATFSSWGHPWPSSMSDIVHNIRVLPLPALRKNSSNPLHLPTISLLNIARYALGKKDLGWRTELMNYGTVCRAWTPVLDLFFESVQTRNCKDRPSIMYVARALEQRPDRRTLMWMFLPAAYREFFDNSRYEMFSQTCVRILGLSTELRNIHLPVTTASAWDDLVKVLQSQKGVRRCTLASPVVHRPPTLHRPYSIDDIQTIVGGWEHLRTLRIDGWITDPETPLCEVGDQTYRLKELRLVTGNITGFQLLRFIPSTSNTMLKKLHLVSVTGLTNNDLRSLLTLVSPTLKELHIQGTPTTREEPDEPYALDATIADMPQLKSVTLDGDHASALAIARKGPGSKDGKPAKDELRGTMSLVVHTEFEVVHAESVVRALGTTGWKHVMVWWNRKIAWNADTEWDDVDFAARVKSIQARGVHLRFKFFDKSVRLTPDVVEYKPGWSPLLLELY